MILIFNLKPSIVRNWIQCFEVLRPMWMWKQLQDLVFTVGQSMIPDAIQISLDFVYSMNWHFILINWNKNVDSLRWAIALKTKTFFTRTKNANMFALTFHIQRPQYPMNLGYIDRRLDNNKHLFILRFEIISFFRISAIKLNWI